MFLKLFLIQKETDGRVSFLKKVFSSLRKAVAEALCLWVPEPVRSACVCVTLVGTVQGQRQVPGAYLHGPDPNYPLGVENFICHLKYPKGSWDSLFLGFSFWWLLLLPLPASHPAPRDLCCSKGPNPCGKHLSPDWGLLHITDVHLS